jgi:hypothetical protein
MRSAAVLLSLAASAFAIQVTFPSQNDVWSNEGPQTLKWTSVNTDPKSFACILYNPDANIIPAKSESLAANVSTADGTVQLRPPSDGWPTGSGFQVNLVKSENEMSTIYAQSAQFSIKDASLVSTTGGSSSVTIARTVANATPLSTGAATPADGSSALNPSETSTTPKNGALAVMGSQKGVVAIAAVLGAFLF